ncbi:MAG: DUF6350 family protein [Brevibacterium sp.]|uniref:cell division protein PerM n=1 Tax=Brevibacterium sp. TaxID=1701 RepID=UPI0026470A88|nr:DUF6350 family protein [Brevibacterium sp.]MDN5805757.1 DUF6350 family protein [Brevibacterium sp.]MDN5834175.1 DUF6350 family protein [Brevibacterium sp.]MDN5876185.1 DUF6350 family protein [Brevibacterium sp.]MDN5909222.1 DUF6350 family protein [Brevibacterium sp.]MDN6133573.1 DUF6350 family protein [Brevibacterium sp.]
MHTSPQPRTHRHPVLLGLVEALRIDLITVPATFVIATVFWLIGLGSQLPYSIIPEWAFALWGVVHGLSVSTMGFDFSLAPSLITLGVWFFFAAGAKRLVAGITEAEFDDIGDASWWKKIIVALATYVIAYAGPLVTLTLLLGEGALTPLGFLRLALMLLSASAAGFLWVRGLDDIPRLPDLDHDAWEVGARLVKRLLWGSAFLSVLVIAAGIVLRWDELAESLQAYSSPLSAGVGLLIIQILFAPGILFAALSWVGGTGVNVGAGDLSSVFHPVPGPVPHVPVLQLLVGDYPAWTQAAPVLLVLLGVLSVIVGRDHARQVMAASWAGLGIAAVKLFVVLQILAIFARGAMGPLGLSVFGPSPLTSAVVMTAWLVLGMTGGLVLTRLSDMQGGSSTSGDQDGFDDEPFGGIADERDVDYYDED